MMRWKRQDCRRWRPKYPVSRKIAQFIATSPIVDLCLVLERRPRLRVSKRWLDQDGLDLEGMRMEDQEAVRTEGEEETDETETVMDLISGGIM